MAVLTAYIHVECPKKGEKVYVHADCAKCNEFRHIGLQGRTRMYVLCSFGEKPEAKLESKEEPGDEELIQMEEEVTAKE